MSLHLTTQDEITVSTVAAPRRRRGRATRTVLASLAAAATVVVLAGCGGGSAGSPAAGSPAAAGEAASDGDGAKAPYSDAEACAWLKDNMPTGPDAFLAQFQLTGGLASFFEEHGGLEGADGYAFDDAAARECPALRTEALRMADIKSFGNL